MGPTRSGGQLSSASGVGTPPGFAPTDPLHTTPMLKFLSSRGRYIRGLLKIPTVCILDSARVPWKQPQIVPLRGLPSQTTDLTLDCWMCFRWIVLGDPDKLKMSNH